MSLKSEIEKMASEEGFEKWWNEWAATNYRIVDTRMINFAQEIWCAALGKVIEIIDDEDPYDHLDG